MSNPAGLILDFAGVLTSNMVQTYDLWELREFHAQGTYLRAWADPRGAELYRKLELGEISQAEWNQGFGELMRVDPTDLMGRLLLDLEPAREVLRLAGQARAAGVRTAVLSNSLGRSPYDPYAPYELDEAFDVVVMSDVCRIRKPDPAIFQLALDKLGVEADSCLFADDTEENLVPAATMGMSVFHAYDERQTVMWLRRSLAL